MEKLIAAIDIGTTKIVALTGKSVGNNKVEIVAMGKNSSLGVQRGVVQNVEKTSQSIKKALDSLYQNQSQLIEEVWVGIAGQHVRSVKSKNSLEFDDVNHRVTLKDIETLVQKSFGINTAPNEMVVNVSPQSFEIEEGRLSDSPIGKESKFLNANFHLTIAQEGAFNNINKSLELNNISVNELVLESIASAKSVLTKQEITEGIALIDIGGGTSDLAIFHNGSVVHSAVIPFGGEVITSDIMQAFNLEKRYAEALKHEYGNILQGSSSKEVISLKNIEGQKIKIKQKELSFVIKTRIEEIIDLIQFQMEMSGYLNKISKGIVLTGGGALLKDITQIYAFHFNQLPIRIGKPNQQFFSGEFDENLNEPLYSTATGLLLFGIENEKLKEKEEKLMRNLETQNSGKENKPSKSNPFNSFRRRLSNMFNEDDAEL